MADHKEKYKHHKVTHGHYSPTYNLLFHIGKWRKLIPDERRKIIIAQALNKCVCRKRFKIVGYLITERRVCLILDKKKTKLKKGLKSFDKYVEKEVKHYLNRHGYIHHETHRKHKGQRFILGDLFKCCTLYNQNLIKLITGRKAKLPYYSSHLKRLKDLIHDYNFCSAINYDGGISPVDVKVKPKSYWKKHHKHKHKHNHHHDHHHHDHHHHDKHHHDKNHEDKKDKK
ncbi:hypothetical protein [uncultured Winogradskyella sp.]|uniref:hypothetical protein n=1 Tax=uncultured Winogradskyella sp. TaxID=395353 RepID=UPI00262FB6A4|nr:hypothetical protein [uncultured Winogradskyella sp.]